jgi:hypothetical protein
MGIVIGSWTSQNVNIFSLPTENRNQIGQTYLYLTFNPILCSFSGDMRPFENGLLNVLFVFHHSQE